MLSEPKISYKPFWGICRPLNSWRANSPNPIQIYCALIKEKAQEDQEIRCAKRMGMEATMNDAVRIANNTAPSDSKTKNIRKNRKEESITFMESNTIGSRLNTEKTPPMIPMNDTEPEVLAEPEPQNNSEIVSFDEALAKIMEKM